MSLLQMSGSAAVLIVVIVVIRALGIHKLPKQVFKVLWGIVALQLLLPFRVSSPLSIYSLIERFSQAGRETLGELPAQAVIRAVPAVQQEVMELIGQSTALVSPLYVLWGIGMLTGLLFCSVAYAKCLNDFQSSLPVQNPFISDWLDQHKLTRPIQIRQSDKTLTPLTYGLMKPVILLPKTTAWEQHKQLEYVLTHELVHIKRFDALYKLLLTVCLCVHWFNPLVWVMFILACRDIELSCDEQVICTFGQTMKSFYAHTLISMEERKTRINPLCNHFSRYSTEERILSIMKMKKTTLAGILIAALVVAGTTTVFATTAAASNPKGSTEKHAAVLMSITDQDTGKTKLSTDGGDTWLVKGEYTSTNPAPEVVWWSYDEYKVWMEQELQAMQTLVDNKESGYFDESGVPQPYTQARVEEAKALYEDILAQIKSGMKVSKTVDGRSDIMISLKLEDDMPVDSSYSMTMDPVIIGPYETKEELLAVLEPYCKQQVEAGAMTQAEAVKLIADVSK